MSMTELPMILGVKLARSSKGGHRRPSLLRWFGRLNRDFALWRFHPVGA